MGTLTTKCKSLDYCFGALPAYSTSPLHLFSSRLPSRLHGLPGAVLDVLRRQDLHATVAQNLLARLDVGALQAHNKRNGQPDLLCCRHNPFGYIVAAKNSRENVHEDLVDDAFVWVARQRSRD